MQGAERSNAVTGGDVTLVLPEWRARSRRVRAEAMGHCVLEGQYSQPNVHSRVCSLYAHVRGALPLLKATVCVTVSLASEASYKGVVVYGAQNCMVLSLERTSENLAAQQKWGSGNAYNYGRLTVAGLICVDDAGRIGHGERT